MTETCPGGTQGHRLASLLLLLLATYATGASGCTALVLSAAEQCENDDQCSFLGPEFSCDMTDKVCKRGEVDTACESDQDCEDAGLMGYTCDADGVCQPPALACTTSQECVDAASGAPAACIDNECVNLTTSACQEVVPEEAIGDDDTIYIGWMGPLTGQFESIGVPIKQAVELAFEEIEQFTNGLPGGTDGNRRKLAMIACHDLGEMPEDYIAVAEHLVNNVKVPAIIGPAFSGITLDVATEVTIQGGTLIVSPSATSPAITDLDDNGLVWRTAPSDALQAIPLAYLVGQLETRIRTDLMLMPAPTDLIKVAAAVKGDAYGQGLIGALSTSMTFNGQDVTDNSADNVFLSRQYDPADELSPVVQEFIAEEPHLILPLGTNEGITDVMDAVEAGWNDPAPRPLYLFPDGGRLDELLASTTSNADLRARVKGTVPGKQGANYQQFALRYEQRWGTVPGTFAENAYDAAYLIAYSIVATGEVRPIGEQIAEAMKRMTGGQTDVVAGPNALNSGFNALSGGGAIDFDGASGPLDFDTEKGEAASDIDIWCVELDNQMDAVFVSTGEFYSAATGAVTGNDTCNP